MTAPSVFTVRLDDKMRYGIEIFSDYLGYRSASKFVTKAIEDQFTKVEIHTRRGNDTEIKTSAEVLDEIWHPDELVRFAKTATNYPGLMTDEQRQIWQFVVETPVLWLNGEWRKRADGSKYWDAEKTEANLDVALLRTLWADYSNAAKGNISSETLKKRINKKINET